MKKQGAGIPVFIYIRHVSPGILRDRTLDDKLMYLPNDDKQNYPIFIKVRTIYICINQLGF